MATAKLTNTFNTTRGSKELDESKQQTAKLGSETMGSPKKQNDTSVLESTVQQSPKRSFKLKSQNTINSSSISPKSKPRFV